jgi:hypothetical protein
MEQQIITVSGMLARMEPPELFLRAEAVVEAVVSETSIAPVFVNVRDDEYTQPTITQLVRRPPSIRRGRRSRSSRPRTSQRRGAYSRC